MSIKAELDLPLCKTHVHTKISNLVCMSFSTHAFLVLEMTRAGFSGLSFPLLHFLSRQRPLLGPFHHALEVALQFGSFPFEQKKSRSLSSHILKPIEFLVKLDILTVPAIELGLLQRDVRIRIWLAFFLHISFSFLSNKLEDVQLYSFKLSTFSLCQCPTFDLYSEPISSLPLRGLWIPAPPAVGK